MDLSSDGVNARWQARGASISQVIRRMENCQNWTVDDELPQWMTLLGDAMNSPEVIEKMAKFPHETAEFLSWIGTGRAVAILEALDEAQFGTAAKIIESAQEIPDNPAQRVFVEGLQVLSQMQLLSDIFSPDRMVLVEMAVRTSRSIDHGK